MTTKLRSPFSLQPLAFALLALFTTTPPVPAQSSWGNALSFDGVDDYVSATIPALASNYTVSAWVFLRFGGNYDGRMAVLSSVVCGGSAEILIHSPWSSFLDPQILELGRCGQFDGNYSGDTVPLSQWVHLAVTVSSNRLVSYFINGDEAGGYWFAGTNNLTIGPNIVLGNNATSGRKFDGLLDEVQIWSKERTQTEIQADMNNPLTGSEAGLLAYWKFDEGAGTVTADATTNGCNGVLVNSPSWTDSRWPKADLGSALSFDGVDDYVDLGPSAPVLGTNFTEEAWIYPQASDDYFHGFLGCQDSGGSNYSAPSLSLYQRTKLHFAFGFGSGAVAGVTPDVLTSNAWNHVAATYDGSLYRVYVNGQPVCSVAAVAVPFPTPVRNIGRVDNYFPGVIDEVRIWRVARTQAEIQANMGHPLTGAEANLVACYRFSEGTGITVHDATTNGFNGVLVNGPSWTHSTAPQARGWGNALAFDGTGLINAAIPKLWDNYTFSAWIYLTRGGNNRGGRNALGVLSAGCGQSAELMVYSDSASSTDPQYLWFGRCGVFGATHSTLTVPLNRWVHVAVTVSWGGTVGYFINGSPAGSWDGHPWPNGVPIGPGITLADSVNRSFYGMMDEVQIWSRARTRAEIAADMTRPLRGTEPYLVAYYRFDEAAGVLAYDGSIYHRNGTFAGRPMRVPSLWIPALTVNGPNPYTNECHVPFADPGASVSGLPGAIAAGYQHSLALKADGTVIGWGDNGAGQTNAPASATNVVRIAAGYGHNLALRRDSTVVSWGLAAQGETNTPAGLTNVVAIAGGGYHSLALKSDGTVTGWGQTTVPGGLANMVAIVAGGRHSLALKSDGTVTGWGDSTYQQTTSPAGLNTAVAIAAGWQHSLALRANGTVIAWGDNSQNQTNVPTGLSNVVAIAACYYHSLALKADGTVVAWGNNYSGEGLDLTGLSDVVAIAAGAYHNLALKTDGTIVGWGGNSFGQTSIPGDVYTLSLPVAVSGLNVDVNGVYTVSYTATTSLGATATRTVMVVGPPQVTLPVSPWLWAGTTSATLNGTVNPGGYDTTAWFEWGTTGDYGSRTEATNVGSGLTSVPVWSQLSGLTLGATYHHRLAASNSLGVAYSLDRLATPLTLISNLADSGAGSLRQSVLNANSGDLLFLTNTGNLYLTNGELVINKDLSIVGPGAAYLAISGSDSSRVLNIGSNASVIISGVQIQSGRSAAGQPGGGVLNAGLLSLYDCVVTGNHAGDGLNGPAEVPGTPGGSGGGIYSSGTLIARRCTISNNSGGNGGNGGWGHDGNDGINPGDGGYGRGGADGGDGGGIYSSGPLTLTDCSLFGNATGSGGSGAAGGAGGWNLDPEGRGGDGGDGGWGGRGGLGGAIYASAVVSLLQCTISGNHAANGSHGGDGGSGGWGFSGDGFGGSAGGDGNGGDGGGLWVSGPLHLASCTIASNASGAGAGWGRNGVGGGVLAWSLVSIVNTIVGLNVSSNLPDHDVAGQFVSLGHNLISTATGDYGPGFDSSLGDLLNVNPGLATLGDYGGPTFTHALLDNSAAVNAGDNSAVSESGADQRGLPRIVGGTIDIGAYEFQYGPLCISSITALPGSNLLLRCTGTSGAAYTLQTSTNLSDWVNLTSMSAGFDGRIEFQVGRTNRADFFRLRSP